MGETVRFFRAWRHDRRTGRVEGLHALDPLRLPREHCCLLEDDDGRLLRLEEHRGDGAPPALTVFGYASRDPRIMEAHEYGTDGTLRRVHRYVYRAGGPVVDRIALDAKGNPQGHVVSEWQDGLEVCETAFDPHDRIVGRHCYEYDATGNMIAETVYRADGTAQGRREMSYDSRGNVIEKRWYAPDGTLQTRYVHAFTDDGLLASSVLYGADGAEHGRVQYEYDPSGNVVTR